MAVALEFSLGAVLRGAALTVLDLLELRLASLGPTHPPVLIVGAEQQCFLRPSGPDLLSPCRFDPHVPSFDLGVCLHARALHSYKTQF